MTNPLAVFEQPNDQSTTASYIEELSGDLAAIARRHGLDTLGYILEMAKLEAHNIRRHLPPKR
jgi:hypothetical protein